MPFVSNKGIISCGGHSGYCGCCCCGSHAWGSGRCLHAKDGCSKVERSPAKDDTSGNCMKYILSKIPNSLVALTDGYNQIINTTIFTSFKEYTS